MITFKIFGVSDKNIADVLKNEILNFAQEKNLCKRKPNVHWISNKNCHFEKPTIIIIANSNDQKTLEILEQFKLFLQGSNPTMDIIIETKKIKESWILKMMLFYVGTFLFCLLIQLSYNAVNIEPDQTLADYSYSMLLIFFGMKIVLSESKIQICAFVALVMVLAYKWFDVHSGNANFLSAFVYVTMKISLGAVTGIILKIIEQPKLAQKE